MNNFLMFFVIGGLVGFFVGRQRRTIKSQQRQITDLTIERNAQVRLRNLEDAILRNEFDIGELKEGDKQTALLIDQIHDWFGSMIRNSAEQPFKKEAIQKFLHEQELKNTKNEDE